MEDEVAAAGLILSSDWLALPSSRFSPIFLDMAADYSPAPPLLFSGKHRKHPGGRGLAGGQHHHRINFDKYHPGYFGKVGMRHFHHTRNSYYSNVLNIDKIWTLVPEEQRKGLTADSKEVPVVDAVAHGFTKVLGKGRLPQLPFIIKTRWVSALAEKKIKEAGGVVSVRVLSRGRCWIKTLRRHRAEARSKY